MLGVEGGIKVQSRPQIEKPSYCNEIDQIERTVVASALLLWGSVLHFDGFVGYFKKSGGRCGVSLGFHLSRSSQWRGKCAQWLRSAEDPDQCGVDEAYLLKCSE